jgi:hypothetical protein
MARVQLAMLEKKLLPFMLENKSCMNYNALIHITNNVEKLTKRKKL